jgi:hypothetical protein
VQERRDTLLEFGHHWHYHRLGDLDIANADRGKTEFTKGAEMGALGGVWSGWFVSFYAYDTKVHRMLMITSVCIVSILRLTLVRAATEAGKTASKSPCSDPFPEYANSCSIRHVRGGLVDHRNQRRHHMCLTGCHEAIFREVDAIDEVGTQTLCE